MRKRTKRVVDPQQALKEFLHYYNTNSVSKGVDCTVAVEEYPQ